MVGPVVAFNGVALSSLGNGTEQKWYSDPAVWPLGRSTKYIQVSLYMTDFTANGGGAATFALYLQHSNDGKRWAAVETMIIHANGTSGNYSGQYKMVMSTTDYGPYIRLVIGVKDSGTTTVQGLNAQVEVSGKPF